MFPAHGWLVSLCPGEVAQYQLAGRRWGLPFTQPRQRTREDSQEWDL